MLTATSVCPSGEGGGAKGDLDHQELLPQRLRQRLPAPLHHHAGKSLQVSHVWVTVFTFLMISVLCWRICVPAGNFNEPALGFQSRFTQKHTLLAGFRVKRLGYYDHTQRQLGERALYIFPAKGDATQIACDAPDGAPVLPEDPIARKVWIWLLYFSLYMYIICCLTVWIEFSLYIYLFIYMLF